MTNVEKLLVLLCMSILIISCIWDIQTLYEVGWDIQTLDEYVIIAVSSIMCYLAITDKI